jgi:hypothetical protein
VQAVTRGGKQQGSGDVCGEERSKRGRARLRDLRDAFPERVGIPSNADDREKVISSSRKAATLVTTLVKVTPFQDYTTLKGRKSVAYL